jgi:hypothetical protein
MLDKNFTSYEKMLIEKTANPKICVLSNGEDLKYLKDLITKLSADITVLNSDLCDILKEKNMKAYDVIIYQSEKHPLSPQDNSEYCDVTAIPAEKFEKLVSVVRVSKYEDGCIRLDEIITNGQFMESSINKHKTVNNLREILNIGVVNLIEYKEVNKDNKDSLLVRKTLV